MENFMEGCTVISVLDTGIATYNIGNQIIMDAVRKELDDMFPESFMVSLPPEDIKRHSLKYNASSPITFVGGTNLLNSDIRKYRQWDLSFCNIMRLKGLVLMGCGWWQYEHAGTTPYTRWALHKVLSDKYLHSVRDSYTEKRLKDIGICSVNTGCPTLWRIDDAVLSSIPVKKSQKAVFTVTDYHRDPERDSRMLDILSEEYSELWFFPQGTGDIQYMRDLGRLDGMKLLPPRLAKYDSLLETGGVDYVGTRLHAGIRALQKGRRSFIIGIDNRAAEMQKDFGLPVTPANDIRSIGRLIEGDYLLHLKIPFDNISRWKKQFSQL